MKYYLVIFNFIEEISVFPILLFSSIYFFGHLGRLSYLSLLFFGTLQKNGYSFLFLLCLSLLFFSQLFIKASSDNHFAFLFLLYSVTNLRP